MRTTFSKSQARRRMRRLFALVARGHTIAISKHGKVACLLVGAEAVGSVLRDYFNAYTNNWGGLVSNDFPNIMGKPARSIADFARELTASFS